MPGVEHISLCRCRVLYLGSSIPLDTAVGIESIQRPCRDRYDNVDSDNRATGIDSVLSVYSSGLLLQYSSDQSTSTWFPIQTLHVCAAVKAVSGNGPLRFVSLDSPAAQASSSPPIFACIMRRTKGIKVLECHVFICKSDQAAMALVQSCMHAFGHKEGWMDSQPALPSARIVPDMGKNNGMRRTDAASSRGGNLYKDRHDLVQKFDVSCRAGEQGTRPAGAQAAYFADWSACGGQPLMIIQDSPFYPGDVEMERYKRKKKKKKKVMADCSDSDEDTYFVRKSDLLGNSGVNISIKKKAQNCCYDDGCYDTEDGGGVLIYAPQYGSGAAYASAYASAGAVYDPEAVESAYNQGAEDQRRIQAAFDMGYCQAEEEAYNKYLEECDGGGGYMDEYTAQPGYTDDCGDMGYFPDSNPEPQGHFELRHRDDYLLRFGEGKKSRFVEVADGLGYYP